MDKQLVKSSDPGFPFREQAAHAVGLLKALSNESRLLIICYLTEAEELSVGELAERVGLSQSALSQHLGVLREQGLVDTRRQAQTIRYRLCDPKAAQVLALLHDLFCPELGRDGKPIQGQTRASAIEEGR